MRSLPKNFVQAAARRMALNFAAMIFLGVAFFHTWQASAWDSLLSWRGLVFCICGLTASGGLIGGVSVRLHQAFARRLAARSKNNQLSARSASVIRQAGTAVLLMQILIIYYLATWAFERWLAI